MRRHIYSKNLKEKVERLRGEGKTYKELIRQFDIPKSTLSTWLGEKYPGVFDKKAQLIHLAKIRLLAIKAKEKEKGQEKLAITKKVRKEIKTYPLKNIGLLKSVLAILYSAEGSKHKGVSGLKFANTDPELSQLYITLLRKCYKLNENKFRIRLHLHYYHGIKKSKKFWSELLNIPLKQFLATHIKKRSRKKRFRRNFVGICFINYLDSNIRKELLELSKQLHQNITENRRL